jgi:hypothetical protein
LVDEVWSFGILLFVHDDQEVDVWHPGLLMLDGIGPGFDLAKNMVLYDILIFKLDISIQMMRIINSRKIYLDKACDFVNKVAAHEICTVDKLLTVHKHLIEFWPTGVAGKS